MNDRYATIHGQRLHYVEAGQGPPVVLLHGFPEFWYSWRHQLPALAAAGHRAIALDLPGYNKSDRPTAIHAYRARSLVRTLAEFIRKVIGGWVSVAGHDWGGVLAWRLAADHPQLLRKLMILNAPHPAAYQRELRRNPGQWIRSAYVAVFQVPGFAEWLLRVGDFALLERAWRLSPIRPNAFSDSDISQYKKALDGPGGLTGPLNYYRAALRYSRDLYKPQQTVSTPTLVIWGDRDRYLCSTLLEQMENWVTDLRIERIPGASHWVQNDAPERVNQLLIDFCQH